MEFLKWSEKFLKGEAAKKEQERSRDFLKYKTTLIFSNS